MVARWSHQKRGAAGVASPRPCEPAQAAKNPALGIIELLGIRGWRQSVERRGQSFEFAAPMIGDRRGRLSLGNCLAPTPNADA
jgi:hypothetical protein